MDERTLARLEFDKIRRQLAEHTTFSAGRRLALDTEPAFEAATVAGLLGLTSEARSYSDRHGAPPLAGAHDMRPETQAAVRGKVLLPQELLDVRDTLTAARRMRRALSGGSSRAHWPRLAELADAALEVRLHLL
ncbi:MAG: hypothetical protein ACK2UL_04835, partial [Anaerolineae bacterium]